MRKARLSGNFHLNYYPPLNKICIERLLSLSQFILCWVSLTTRVFVCAEKTSSISSGYKHFISVLAQRSLTYLYIGVHTIFSSQISLIVDEREFSYVYRKTRMRNHFALILPHSAIKFNSNLCELLLFTFCVRGSFKKNTQHEALNTSTNWIKEGRILQLCSWLFFTLFFVYSKWVWGKFVELLRREKNINFFEFTNSLCMSWLS